MIKISNEHFNIEQICNSGQCFRMRKIAEMRYAVIASDKYLEIEQTERSSNFYCTMKEYEQFWKAYFDLDKDYGKIINKIEQQDLYLTAAAEFGRGIRILKQDVWEMIISFIISQQNNIKRITKSVQTLCETYGEKRTNQKGEIYHLFPTSEALLQVSEEELRGLNFGYRSRYIVKTVKSITNKEVDIEKIKTMDYKTAKQELIKLSGIGEKVAECICLYGLHHLEAFPIDTHIRQVLEEQYKGEFPFKRYTGNAGIIQQYIFYYDLHKNNKIIPN